MKSPDRTTNRYAYPDAEIDAIYHQHHKTDEKPFYDGRTVINNDNWFHNYRRELFIAGFLVLTWFVPARNADAQGGTTGWGTPNALPSQNVIAQAQNWAADKPILNKVVKPLTPVNSFDPHNATKYETRPCKDTNGRVIVCGFDLSSGKWKPIPGPAAPPYSPVDKWIDKNINRR